MTKNIRILLTSAVLAILLVACEKETLNSSESSLNRPVVEAYFHPGHTPHVKITTQIPLNSDSTENRSVNGLTVTVKTGSTTYTLLEKGDGIYEGDSSWAVEALNTYELSFNYLNKLITSTTLIPANPESFAASATTLDVPSFQTGGGGPPAFPDPIALTWDNNDGAFYLIVVENIESDPVSIFNGDGERPTFRTTPEQTNRYELGFQSFSFYGMHRVILFKLNAEYASLYDDNGSSSQNLTTPYSNITGGLGIFTGINSDTLFVNVE
jgi:Domain of unknown function (DUF4249)